VVIWSLDTKLLLLVVEAAVVEVGACGAGQAQALREWLEAEAADQVLDDCLA
jgi:hypothetical protein